MEVILNLESLEKEILKGKKHGLIGVLKIGKSLQLINAGNLWLPTGCKDFPDYCEKTHGIKRASAYNFIAIYNTWGKLILDNPEFQSVDTTRLVRLLPLTTEENKSELLRDAVFVPDVAGFNANLRNRKGGLAPDQCETHQFEPIPYEVCKICGLRRKIEGKE